MSGTQILWRREDVPGHECAWLREDGAGWLLAGTSVFAAEGGPCRLDYRVTCDAGWRTVSSRVDGWIGEREVSVAIAVDADGRWRLNGEPCPQVDGCADVDLNFSPSTNLLPIRRLCLRVGERAGVRAAWLRFPSFTLEPLEQSYRRTCVDGYRYESGGGAFTADLQVAESGFVTRYPGFWIAERTG